MELESYECRGHGFVVRKNTCDKGVINEVIAADCYGLMDLGLPYNAVVVDVGGHIGGFTRFAAGYRTQGRFFTFEANPLNWPVIERNLGCITSEHHLFKGALVGKEPKNKKMYIKADEALEITGGWGINFSDEELPVEPGRAEVSIDNFYTLGEIWKKFDLERIDLLKLDCEGSEFGIIMNTHANILKKVKYIVAEIHCGSLAHVGCTWNQFRERFLKFWHCPALEGMKTVTEHDLFNIRAVSKFIE